MRRFVRGVVLGGSPALCLWLSACAGAKPSPPAAAALPSEVEFPVEPGALLRYHSTRFGLVVPLPDGRAWKIDDHTTGALVAEHVPTKSRLTLESWNEPDVMSRQKCETRARERGLVTLKDVNTLEDLTTVGPDAYDSRVWVVLGGGASPSESISGHVFLFGAFVRKCLFAHYATVIASEKFEPQLTSRLAVARLRILAHLEVVAFDQPPRSLPP